MTSYLPAEALLIHISGNDAPGITAAAATVLAAHEAVILDIGQSVVDERLAISILIAAPQASRVTALSVELHDQMAALGLNTQLSAVKPHSLWHATPGMGKSHFIITILGWAISAPILARTTQVISACGFKVDRIERLSAQMCGEVDGQPALEGQRVNSRGNACLELAISGDLAHEDSLRSQLLAVAQDFSIDIACQHEGIFRLNRRLFAFDMDSTLIQGEVIDELALMAGVGEQVSSITAAAMRGELDFDQSFTRRVALLKGLPAERAFSLLNTIPLADGAERLFRALKQLGLKTAILSGGFKFFARSLQQRFGIDHIHSNELEIVDGLVTGRVISPIINGARKAALLEKIAEAEGISLEQVVAVGDGANDIPMLTRAGMGIAYRAKPIVRQKADHSISSLGLDGLLYLIGIRDRDLPAHEA